VIAAVLAAASALGGVARAQDPVAANSSDIAVDETRKSPAVNFPSLNQFSSYGFSTGLMKVQGGDLGKNAQVKPVLQAVFRYRFNDTWTGVGEFGFGWNSFKDQGDTVLAFNFGTLGAARSIGRHLGTEMRAAGGVGFYRWNYKYKGNSLRDSEGRLVGGVPGPGTQRFYRGIDPGLYVGLESEYRLTRHVTLLGILQQHYVFTADKEKFNRLFDENHGILSFRLGANFHFSPYEGILWTRNTQQKIRLESGRETH
jgi:hypothetical protein